MYEIRPIDASKSALDDVSALLRRVFASATHLTPEYLDWQYNRNPAGKVVGMNAYHEGRLVGHYATLPMRIRLFGREGRTALLLNLAVDREHRGQELMQRMGRRTLEEGRHAGFDCLIGVANDASTRAIGYPLGFVRVCALDARVGMGPLPTRRPGLTPDFERLWSRDEVAWRLANPGARYWLRRRKRCWDVLAPAGRFGLTTLLGTVDAEDARSDLRAPALWRPTLWIGVDPGRRWRPSLYWNLPRRLRPVPLNFMFLDFADPPRPLSPERLRWSGLDFDAY